MKGLLIKEFVSMKRYTRILLVLMVFYLVFTTAFMDDEGFIGSITAMFAIVIAVSSFSYDEAARWNEFACAMPIKRSDIVISKYIFTGALALAGAVLGTVFTLIVAALKGAPGALGDQAAVSAVMLGGVLLAAGVMFPLLYRFGVEKGRFILLGVFLIPSAGMAAIDKLGAPKPAFLDAQPGGWFLAVLVIAAALIYALSCAVSIGIVRRKDRL